MTIAEMRNREKKEQSKENERKKKRTARQASYSLPERK
jgi:hypothetical protein